ncbi:ABC transporter permease [Nakamurella leprariae]|uniref:ABC transporter permease n=1 Tax=Nakamurella leprariae TaxID=2803911 RepID=A0A939BVR6_9ACTN|nr:ABC transporter permease subunit [Nakamurella leprariae]MBM9466793.1 ABC transporter permease [Nakamurella leprariae]
MSQVHDRSGRERFREHSTEVAVTAMETVGAKVPTSTSGAPAGFRSDHTLPVAVELRRQLRRRRTQLALVLMALLPIILVVAFAFDDGDTGGSVSLVDLATTSATNFAVVCLFFSASFLLIVVIALFFGDTIASEASWSSLRYLLAMPVPRIRLLRQKVIVAGLLSVAALLVLPVVAVVVGLIAYGGGPLATPVGEQLSFGTALLRLALILAFIAVQLAWVAGLALMLSVLTDAPLGAVGGAVLLSILSQILNQIEALGVIRDWLPTHYSFAWTGALVNPIRWDDMIRGGFISLLYAVVFATIAVVRFRRKDITS